MKKIILYCLVTAGALLLTATEGFSYSSYGNDVNSLCSPATPFTGDCTLCHASSKSTPTPAKDAYLAGGNTLIDFFCPAGSACTDSDNDTFAIEGGDCGPVDCNDSNPDVHPGAAEVCTDKIDNDCDGLIDVADSNAVGCPPPCTDNDGDGYAVEGGTCGPVDCNDQNSAINPGAIDTPNNGIDENCSGADSVDPTIMDQDGDGYTPAQGDCNDNNPAINPGAVDIPNNGIDENCSGADSVDPTLLDRDGDGYTPAQGDCNDNNPAINPGAVDIPNNGIDENCSGADSVDQTTLDQDGDGYTPAQGDCNDNNPQINPGAVDIPNNGIDENCDGHDNVDASIVDNDGDGFSPANGDCDDTEAAVNPSAVENCTDGIDNNCDGLVDSQDPNAVGCPAACTDSDLDNYATEGGDCGPVDCNDQDLDINPGALEICGDNIDNDCDTLVDEGCDAACPDSDGDGYLDSACGGNDCDDTNAAINPGATEVCGNDVDENCNGAGDAECQTCPDGTLLVIKEVNYDREDDELVIKGRANVNTAITIANADTGEILASGVRVREGKWRAKIDDLDQAPATIRVSNDSGCFTDQQLSDNSGEHRRGEDEHHDYRNNRRESRHHD